MQNLIEQITGMKELVDRVSVKLELLRAILELIQKEKSKGNEISGLVSFANSIAEDVHENTVGAESWGWGLKANVSDELFALKEGNILEPLVLVEKEN